MLPSHPDPTSANIPVALDRMPSLAATASRVLQKIRKSELTPKIHSTQNPNSWPHEVLHSIDCALVHSGPSHLKKSLPLKPSIWEREETICLENNQREHSNNLPRARSSRYWMEPKHSTFWLSPHPTPPTPRPNPNLYCEIPLVWFSLV